MKIFVKCQELHALSVEDCDTAASLKSQLAAREGIKADEVVLIARSGRVLEDSQILKNILVEGSYVDATVGLLGGWCQSNVIMRALIVKHFSCSMQQVISNTFIILL